MSRAGKVTTPMKIKIGADGTLELEVADGDGAAALSLIRALQGGKTEPEKAESDPAGLSRIQRDTYEVLAAHPEGCHYTVVAEFLGLTKSQANSRCQNLAHLGYAARIRAGVYQVTGDQR